MGGVWSVLMGCFPGRRQTVAMILSHTVTVTVAVIIIYAKRRPGLTLYSTQNLAALMMIQTKYGATKIHLLITLLLSLVVRRWIVAKSKSRLYWQIVEPGLMENMIWWHLQVSFQFPRHHGVSGLNRTVMVPFIQTLAKITPGSFQKKSLKWRHRNAGM